MAAEQRSELLAALGTLRDDDREVLGARFLLDLSEAETAETLGHPARHGQVPDVARARSPAQRARADP